MTKSNVPHKVSPRAAVGKVPGDDVHGEKMNLKGFNIINIKYNINN